MKGTRVCKICGNEYEYCRTNRDTGLFRWQDVACCPEHAAEYFALVAVARGEATTDLAVNNEPDDEEFDELFEEDFDDEAEPAIEK